MKLKYKSKEKAQEFLKHLEKIFEDLQSLVPECLHQGMFCPFVQYQKKLELMARSGKYDRFAGSADQFMSGISETYKVIESNSAPVLGVISTPFGSAEYAKRGNTDPIVLAGIQNFDNETWRMLAFSTLVKSKGVRIFSSRSRYIGSCKGDSPDKAFFSEVLEEHSIVHTVSDIIEIGNSERYFDLIYLGQVTIRIHDDSRQNIIPILMKHILTQDPSVDFVISCPLLSEVSNEIPKDIALAYFSGKIDSRDLIRLLTDQRKKIALSRGYSAIGNDLYSSYEEFLSKLDDPVFDPARLISILSDRKEGIMLDNPSFRKLVEILWSGSKEEIVKMYFPDYDISELGRLSGDPLQQLNSINSRFHESMKEQSISVEPWSSDSDFLIELIKIHVKRGKGEGVRFGEKNLTNRTRKAVFYAYLLSLGESKNREWMFTGEEKELGQKLVQAMGRMVNGESPDYNQEIENLRVYVV